MFEAEYLHECERAELLGFPKPDKEAFMAYQSAQAALARHNEEETDRLLARPETNEFRITIYEEPEFEQDPDDDSEDLVEIEQILSCLASFVNNVHAMQQSKKQAKAKSSNLEIEIVEGDAETKTDPQAEVSQPDAITCAIPTTSTEEAQKDEDSQPSRWDALMQLWKNFIYPKKASK